MLADFTVQSNIYAYLQGDRGKEAYRIRSNFFFSFFFCSFFQGANQLRYCKKGHGFDNINCRSWEDNFPDTLNGIY